MNKTGSYFQTRVTLLSKTMLKQSSTDKELIFFPLKATREMCDLLIRQHFLEVKCSCIPKMYSRCPKWQYNFMAWTPTGDKPFQRETKLTGPREPQFTKWARRSLKENTTFLTWELPSSSLQIYVSRLFPLFLPVPDNRTNLASNFNSTSLYIPFSERFGR